MSAGFADAERSAQHWRRLEAEARLIASTMADPSPKRIMLSIAEAYKRLAERAELRNPQQLMANASFGPHALKVIGEAFDAAWVEITANFSKHPVEIEVGRLKLATALLSVAKEDSRDMEALKKAALLEMARGYRSSKI